MSEKEKETKFDLWWGSPEVKRKVGAAYSLGAAVVIIGAMFKILHLPFAGEMLGIGMSVEAVLFALGVFDKPHKEYEWERVYDFEGNGIVGSQEIAKQSIAPTSRAVGLNYTETISDDDVKKLSEGIRNLSATAQQFAGLSNVVGATDQFVKNMDGASEMTAKLMKNQESLNSATGLLTTSYKEITEGMEVVEKNTKIYAGKVDNINKNLSSINSIYEIQLQNIHAQTEGLTQQTERVRKVNDELGTIVSDVQKMKSATAIAATETESMKAGTAKLANQIADLNLVYGNMLNALS